jgi:LmbE family N-acetylglucosaminyl deacetylase
VLILAEGVTSRDQERDREKRRQELSALAAAAHRASKILGASSLRLHDLPDNRMDSCALLDIVKVVEASIGECNPEVIYTHHAGDLNIDHRRVHEAVVTASRPLPGRGARRLLFFEVASSTEWQTAGSGPTFAPTWYVDVSLTLPLKIQALEAYETELHPFPHPRSTTAVEHLARWRGASVGVAAAEAFVLGRNVVR